MHLYDCRVGTFIPQATSSQIADVLRERFVDRLDQCPSPSEVTSWRNSLSAFVEADFLLNLNSLNVALSRPRKKLIVVASRSVIDLLISDLEVFENTVIWKRLHYQCATDVLWQGRAHGVPVRVRGKLAGAVA